MAEKKTNSLISFGNVAKNRKATFNYSIIEKVEAGIMLKGPEVKSLRHGRATINESFAGERDGDIWLFNSYIPEYQGGVFSQFDPRAPRKLLLHHKQINKLLGAISREGMTLVPLDIFFNSRGIAKVSLGLGLGKKKTDKRQAIADRDWKRDKARLLRNKI
ncbi:ssrA-binding protein [Commensalibacter intestini A911]|uniref:SsrA-binding protein n=2 Tax=Commensalibacter intestini TaxID=479936 RepID=A0A251ZXK9_9PROT|nr:SsrA-binding protein SmpB [Commensalibacter intestini]EHD14856.1 ssrA-binding protein [Commensalibacter intestini A911]OUI79391.1 SsrA-binding protein [Commensalibacter intestini]